MNEHWLVIEFTDYAAVSVLLTILCCLILSASVIVEYVRNRAKNNEKNLQD